MAINLCILRISVAILLVENSLASGAIKSLGHDLVYIGEVRPNLPQVVLPERFNGNPTSPSSVVNPNDALYRVAVDITKDYGSFRMNSPPRPPINEIHNDFLGEDVDIRDLDCFIYGCCDNLNHAPVGYPLCTNISNRIPNSQFPSKVRQNSSTVNAADYFSSRINGLLYVSKEDHLASKATRLYAMARKLKQISLESRQSNVIKVLANYRQNVLVDLKKQITWPPARRSSSALSGWWEMKAHLNAVEDLKSN